jgi:hypothetical protein
MKRFRTVRDIYGTHAREESTTDASEMVYLLYTLPLFTSPSIVRSPPILNVIRNNSRPSYVQTFGGGRVLNVHR